MSQDPARWCILRTSGSRTLTLTRSLVLAGIDAWTPVQRVKRRLPRAKKIEHIEAPFTPCYVFVKAPHLPELCRLERTAISPHPAFSVFRHMGATVIVADASVSSLRAAEDESRRRADRNAGRTTGKPRGQPFDRGETVKARKGPFAGLNGIVQSSDGRHTLILFGTRMEVRFGTSQLRSNPVAIAPTAA